MLKATGLKKSYGELAVLKEVTIEVSKGEVVAIVGSSGAGKSTLLHILGTLDSADSGSYLIGDKDVFSLNEKQLAKFRNEEIGFIFQFHHLLPEFTALENVCIPAFLSDKSKQNAEFRALELLDFLGLKDRINHKPAQLSGGEQQRVAVARALMNEPSIIMADEPSGNLDTKNSEDLHELFFKLRDSYGQTFIIVTHNESLADMADRKLTMKDGRFI
ncbi:MAG: ABC transporter ATP-binding protein [Chitinophagales bacterium]|jgi:lipoprotein-releasing system ATP-binding protein|tara:strand:+ start:18633 stop:19283 length:651 start_codon:yes stop_codon:yes gene_type:complete